MNKEILNRDKLRKLALDLIICGFFVFMTLLVSGMYLGDRFLPVPVETLFALVGIVLVTIGSILYILLLR